MDPWWKSWPDVKRLTRGKKIILYGRSEDWVYKTMRRLPALPAYIADRNDAYRGTTYAGLPVELPTRLDDEDWNGLYVVITTGSYDGVVAFLIEKGLEPGRHFCCSPEFKDFAILDEIRNYEQTLLISSSDYTDPTRARYSRAGGGLFRYHLGPNCMERLATGSYRQMVKVNDILFAVEYVKMELHVFDASFQRVAVYSLDRPNYCGLAYAPERKVLLLVNAGQDTLSVHEVDGFRKLDEIRYSGKFNDGDAGHHHLNDVCVAGDYVYVCYFSHTGNWKRGVYDGGVSELHIDRLSASPVPVYERLWMPHSPKIIDGNLCVLDSMRGQLWMQSQEAVGTFDGFVRGLVADDRYIYVGQSEDMYFGRGNEARTGVMLNAGFYQFDPLNRAYRFHPMLDHMNVHDLLVL